MFNEERKMRFIEEREEEVVLPASYLSTQFNKIEKMENEFDKDLCNFTAYEIIEYYKMLNITSIESLAVMNSQFSLYTNWCLKQNLVKDNQNHFLEINYDILGECMNKALFNMRMVSRETILGWIDMLVNPRDQFIILALYEGIRGKENCELVQLKPEDVKGNIVTLCTGRQIKISDQLAKIIKQCIATDEYYGGGGRSFPLIENGYVIKDYNNVKDDVNSYQQGKRIYNSISRTIKAVDKKYIVTANSIVESGKLDMIKNRSEELGMTPKEYITSDYIKEVEQQYGCTIVHTVYLKKYKDYLV